jgi:hypothetical protein
MKRQIISRASGGIVATLLALRLALEICPAAEESAPADPTSIPLAMKTRVYLANIEERGITLSSKGFPAIKAAIKADDPVKLRSYLSAGFRARVMPLQEGPELALGAVTMKRINATDPGAKQVELDADGFV